MKRTKRPPGSIIFVTGTDTGVGKTVFTTLLLRELRASGTRALAMKPFCSGPPDDVDAIRKIQGNELPESLLNPFHFEAPIAPWVAANDQGLKIRQAEVVRGIRAAREHCDILVVEGAGGLLTPLGERFTALDLILELDSEPVLVAPNRLGCLNQISLALAAFRSADARPPRVVLMEQKAADSSARSNVGALRRWHANIDLFCLPQLNSAEGISEGKRTVQNIFKKTLALSNASGRTGAVLLSAVRQKSKKQVDGSR